MRDSGESSVNPGKTPPPRPRNRHRPGPQKGSLYDSRGPDPETPLEEVQLTVGTVVGSHGLQGEMKVRLATDDPEHFSSLQLLYLADESSPRQMTSCRFHQGMALILLDGIETPDDVAAHRGSRLSIKGTSARPLAPGEFYLYQLIGLLAQNEEGEPLGKVIDIIETGAADVFVIRPDSGQDMLLPDLPDVILSIEPESRRMVVRPLVYDE